MNSILELNSGEFVVVWSDNEDEQTYNVYPASQRHSFDPSWDTTTIVKYSEVKYSMTVREYFEMNEGESK